MQSELNLNHTISIDKTEKKPWQKALKQGNLSPLRNCGAPEPNRYRLNQIADPASSQFMNRDESTLPACPTGIEQTGMVAQGAESMEAFTRFWDASRVSIRAYLSSMLPNPSLVDDCLQEVAIVGWKKAPKDKTQEDFLAYCLACARRIAKSSMRKNKINRLALLAPDVVVAMADTIRQREAEDSSGAEERLRALRACMEKLDAGQRELLESRYSDSGITVGERAVRSGQSADKLYKQLERLRTALRSCVSRKLEKQS